MRLVLAIFFLVTAVFPARAERVDLELILAVDISGSVDDEEARLQRAGTVAALTDKKVIRAIKSGRLGRIAGVASNQRTGVHPSGPPGRSDHGTRGEGGVISRVAKAGVSRFLS